MGPGCLEERPSTRDLKARGAAVGESGADEGPFQAEGWLGLI